VNAFFADFGAAMDVEEFTPLTFADNGDDVLTVVQFRARSRATGKVAAMHLHHWFHFRDDKIDYYRGTEDTAITVAALAGA
jgi:ketosteroid isomerase-like protein